MKLGLPSNRNARPIAGIIDRVVHALGHSTAYGGWLAVAQWPEIVGPEIADVARAVRFSDGILIVAVPDPSWRQELSFRREEILGRIHRRPYGKVIKEVRLVRGERRID
jgi:predicted nucleic acid-binding Zn ribbon protein